MNKNISTNFLCDHPYADVLSKVEPQILSVAIINLNNLADNYHKIRSEASNDVIVSAVIKANSYGFGAKPISRRLYAEGCRYFFVMSIEEGISARSVLKDDAGIFVLSGLIEGSEPLFCEHNLTPVLNNMYQIELWTNYAKKLQKKLCAGLHIDTGMLRNGLCENEIEKCLEKIKDNINLDFIMSHLACADVLGHEKNDLQLRKFQQVIDNFGNVKKSFSATNGTFLGKDYHFDIIRPGKALYGFSIREDKVGSFKPVMDVFSRIVQINNLSAGDSVGYGATFTAEKDMKTITIGIGYADGFMRKFSGFGHGFLGGKKIPMVGRISMDYIVLDVSDVDDDYIKMGAWVALTQSPEYTLEKWALELGTIPHEISCRFGERVKRIYIGDIEQ